MGLRMKGETIDEIVGAASVMRSLATPVDIDTDGLIDLAGTGGDGANLFNVSTALPLLWQAQVVESPSTVTVRSRVHQAPLMCSPRWVLISL